MQYDKLFPNPLLHGTLGHRNAAHLHRGIVEHHGTFWGNPTQLMELKLSMETSSIEFGIKTQIFS